MVKDKGKVRDGKWKRKYIERKRGRKGLKDEKSLKCIGEKIRGGKLREYIKN